jgi:hypothetical protein
MPALFANQGETMAEVYARINGPRTPSWTSSSSTSGPIPTCAIRTKTFAFQYSALSTTPPVDPGCVMSYNATCRIVINYEQHIHPIWGAPRPDEDDVDVDRTCTSCHSDQDDMGMAMVPLAQLDLGDGASAIRPTTSRAIVSCCSTTTGRFSTTARWWTNWWKSSMPTAIRFFSPMPTAS